MAPRRYGVAMSGERDPMLLAIRAALEGLERGEGGPFGAAIVRGGEVIAVAHNTVLRDRDPTAHAEVNAIRMAARRLGTYHLSGCEIYSTTEPCLMCFGAIHWARIGRLYYGTSIEDVAALGFREIRLPVLRIREIAGLDIEIVPSYKRGECLKLLERWRQLQLPTY